MTNFARKPEITWSLMHPTELNVEYMRQAVEFAKNFTVDSFEICAECHSNYGGMDGLADYKVYPAAAQALDQQRIQQNRERLQQIVALAHAAGKPLVYWHREAMVPEGLLSALPHLLDESGEFNLLGEAYEELLRYKIAATFEAVPELDGLVLTLTEASYSVIHSAAPDKYPPQKAVEHIVRIFADELQKRNKRFVLRSFGSIEQDYLDILAGAEAAAKDYKFEIETKITPYDFDPFLPVNKFLRKVPGTALGAECDSLGEFLGSGMLPAENVENIVQYVRSGRAAGVDRYIIRADRIGNRIFDRYMINLYAYERAIENETITAEEIIEEYLAKNVPAEHIGLCRKLTHDGLEVIKKLHFIDGSVISHQTPPQSLKYLKAGFIFALFKNGVTLENGSGVWSILSERCTPSRKALMAEKAEAWAMTQKNLQLLQQATDNKSVCHELQWRKDLWSNANIAAETIYLFCNCVCCYFDDMEAQRFDGANFFDAVENAQARLTQMAGFRPGTGQTANGFVNGLDLDLFKSCSQVREFYPAAWFKVLELLKKEFAMESSMRQKYAAGADDCILCAAITDEWRVWRYMHASHAAENGSEIFRFAGNTVFPNGEVKMALNVLSSGSKLVIYGDPAGAKQFYAKINQTVCQLEFDAAWQCSIPLGDHTGKLELTLRKADGNAAYPAFRAAAVLKK